MWCIRAEKAEGLRRGRVEEEERSQQLRSRDWLTTTPPSKKVTSQHDWHQIVP